MNRPVDLEETDTTVAFASHDGMNEVALTLRNEESSFFQFIWPYFANDCS
jgi:hypothetical protein